jgi:hypothetical protein
VTDRVINRFAASGIAGIKPAPMRLAMTPAAVRARDSRSSSIESECDAGAVALSVTPVDGNLFKVALADLSP